MGLSLNKRCGLTPTGIRAAFTSPPGHAAKYRRIFGYADSTHHECKSTNDPIPACFHVATKIFGTMHTDRDGSTDFAAPPLSRPVFGGCDEFGIESYIDRPARLRRCRTTQLGTPDEKSYRLGEGRLIY